MILPSKKVILAAFVLVLLLGLSIWPASVSARSFPGNSSAVLAGVSQRDEGTTIFASVRVPYEGLETAHVSPTGALDDAPQSCKDDLDRKLRQAASIEQDGSFVTAITVCKTEPGS